ncbi:fimbrial protein [Luteibacter sp. PPL201]|uniref:Fimbrial protein n=1 Tax=Luteibacter sahnii TaxID=3021977 RepID=A0ABT6BE18_9GAMM|nr:fimbrial protein [Luteibacter sp. PPL193]MDY1548797.1 fimbrial protein [Luteibacter sp. PPL193]
MNLKALTSALLIAGLAASPAFAETGSITFTGSVANVTCTVQGENSGGPNFTVDMGSISAGEFANVGDYHGSVGFRIRVGGEGEKSCPDGTKVWAHFDADGTLVDARTGMVKVTNGANAASGVQIRLFNENGEKIDIFNDQKIVKQTVKDNQATIVHTAAYERVGDIAAGQANGLVRYTMNFEPTS